MNNLAIPLSGVDALHAHFAEWVKFLDAKGVELKAQLAKLEARKTHTPSSPVELRGSGYLELAFGDQEIPPSLEGTTAAIDAEPALQVENAPPEEQALAEGQEIVEASQYPHVENQASAEPPILKNSKPDDLDPQGNWVHP